jgi:type III restriction enzyme
MPEDFFSQPIVNSPYARPAYHWKLDENGQPTNEKISARRKSELISPVPAAKKQKAKGQAEMTLGDADGLSTAEQEYNPLPIINELRQFVDDWRALPNPNQWQVTPETARLLQHWRSHEFNGVRPFFCQIEAVETAIWLTEVAPKSSLSNR